MANPILGPDQNGHYWQASVDASAGVGQEVPVISQVAGPTTNPLSTYTVGDALDMAKTMAKGIPFNGIDVKICDAVNSAIYKYYPWRDSLALIANGYIPLVDGQQDYSSGGMLIFRLTQMWMVRTDVTPNQVILLDVAKSLNVNPSPQSPAAIRAASLQAGVGKIRLEFAPRIPTGSTWELRGEYQPLPAKILSLSDGLWFPDVNVEVFAKGLMYWAYRLADDSRSGEMTTDDAGRARYTGQLGVFMKAIADMAAAEDFGNNDGYYPDDSIGSVDGRRYATEVYPII